MSIHATLTTVELLESILLQLPIRDALRVQQVSKSWRDIILESSQLQRALFLKPESLPSSKSLNKHEQMHFIGLDTPCCEVVSTVGTKSLMASILPVVKTENATFTLQATPTTAVASEPSWRKMLLSQPPRKAECFFGNFVPSHVKQPTERSLLFHPFPIQMNAYGGASIVHGSIFDLGAVEVRQTDGLTLGAFVDAISEHEAAHKRALTKCDAYSFGWRRWIGTLGPVITMWQEMKQAAEGKLIAQGED